MKNKVIFIIPYFGRFNNYFQLFLNSCKVNSDFNWLILTDDDRKFQYPDNVIVKKTTFKEIQNLVKSKFDFDIVLHKPYKICDYKIAYGYIFEEYIEEYNFWGFCDVDLIWGNISHFITDELLDNYDRVLARGHFTLFRNNQRMNSLFMIKDESMFVDYEYAFKTKYCCHFDEMQIWTKIFTKYGIRQWNKDIFADIDCNKMRFSLVYGNRKNNPQIFVWKEDSLMRYYVEENTIKKDEWMYIHLQKRKMDVICEGKDKFCIVPNEFINYPEKITVPFLEKYTKNNYLYFERRKGRIKEIITNLWNGALIFRWKKFKRKG